MEEKLPEKVNLKKEIFDWLDSLMISLTILTVVFTFIIGTVVVNGRSMQPTLMNNERLLILPTYYSINFQDVVVIHREGDTPLVKRVIATEGQTVDIDFDQGIVYVDGKALDEPYAAAPATSYHPEMFITFPATVPKGHVFVMGDNRNDSLDSRYKQVGMIKTDKVFGKVIFRVFPLQRFSTIH